MEIRNAIAVDELQRGLAAKELDHARALAQKGAHALGIELVAQFMAQVGLGQGRVFIDAGGQSQWVARDPHPATRPGGGTAVLRVFFEHPHLQAQVRRGHGRGQPPGP